MSKREIKYLAGDLLDVIKQTFGEPELKIIADWIKDTIYKRTKTGVGLKSKNRKIGGVDNKELAAVSDSYVEYRQKYPPKGKFAPKGKSNKSNLTYTGELLDSMKAYVKGERAYVMIPNGDHGSGISLHDLLDEVEKVRPFFGLSNTEAKILDSMIRRMIRDKLRKMNQK